jgi:hypothetical protein
MNLSICNRFIYLFGVSCLSVSMFLTSCSDDTVTQKSPLTIATTYDSTGFTTNSTAELAVRTALINLTNEAKKGRTSGVKVSSATLSTLYQGVGAVATSYYNGKMSEYITEIEKASGGVYDPKKSPAQNGEGGTFGGYLFDENGLEMEQMIEKGSFASAQYNHALTIMNQPMSVANVDKIVRIFGAHPAFANTDNGTNPNRDIHSSAYTARRDKNDGNGLYSQMKNALLKAQSAAKAGKDYEQEYKDAMTDIRLLWEKALMATVINYCYSAKAIFAKTNPTDAELGSALHAYGEAVGFLHGWRTIQTKRISDIQIDEILILFLAPANGTPTSYRFVQDAFNTVGNFDQVIAKLATVYSFTPQELEGFKSNWVSVQSRK